MSDDLLNIEQLGKLAEVLNTFKSEAVQLRILEALLAPRKEDSSDSELKDTPSKPRRRAKNVKRERNQTESSCEAAGVPAGKAGGRLRKSATGNGAIASLKKLMDTGFFSEPKTINDIIEDCKHNMARTFKANDFSGAMVRLVRKGDLTRKKNSDDQYEYTKK